MNLHPYHGALPNIHPDAWIAPGAHIIGDVTVAEGASIWFGSVLRGDVSTISIGRFSNVQDNSVIHADPGRPCTVGEYVTLGHAVIVHGCTIDDRVLVGMGAVVMNGAHVHSDTILAARALVPEERDIPGKSLVIGMPGKIVRELNDDELASLWRSADHYAARARDYKSGA